MNKTNQVWQFFSSVKLAIFTLCALSLTSIIGTVVPQNRPIDFYVEQYGTAAAQFFRVLDIPQMYTSWWFLTLLGLLSANLIVCSIDRFPLTWKQITLDQTTLSPEKLEKMAFTRWFPEEPGDTAVSVTEVLRRSGWRLFTRETAGGTITAAQKGRWSRTGVYLVHASILVIFAGAITGYFLGFKGSVLIPETKESDKIYAPDTQQPIDLGFTVRCDTFDIEFYDNGMPKEYRSRLTVLENGETIMVKDIEVNHPLKYHGITFYQSSYEAYRDFVITLVNPDGGGGKQFIAPFQRQVDWSEKDLSLGIINAEAVRERVVRMKLWIKSGQNPPVTLWLEPQSEISLAEHGVPYTIKVKQMYATGLQVAKDPGVWLVYLGCLFMLAGLYIAFFMSHRRIWIVTNPGGKRGLLIAGTANKNRLAFEKTFTGLITAVTTTVR